MTARENPASEPVAGAPARQPGQTAIQTKPVRVTAGLDPATYTELSRWVASAAIAVNPDSRGCRWRRRSAR